MRKLLLKLHKSSSSVDFIKKSLFNNIAPTFAKVKGKFINDNTKAIAEKEAMKNHPEAVVQRCSVKKVFLEIPQNPQENTCSRVSFFNKVGGLRPATLLKKRLWHRCFSVNFVKFLRTHFFIEHLRWLLLTILPSIITDLKLQYDVTKNKIQSNIGIVFTKILIRFIKNSLRTERLESFKVKNNKIFNSI